MVAVVRGERGFNIESLRMGSSEQAYRIRNVSGTESDNEPLILLMRGAEDALDDFHPQGL